MLCEKLFGFYLV